MPTKILHETKCLVSRFYITTTIRELNRGQTCVAFNKHQIETLKKFIPNLKLIPREWYTLIQKENKKNETECI